MMYSERKAAQAAAFFLFKASGQLNVLKIVKLLYLAERESFKRYGEPMIGDKLVSLDYGPVLSRTLNHLNGAVPSDQDGWEAWISDRADHLIELRQPVTSPAADLLQLSEADIAILGDVWQEFGAMDRFALADLTHTRCTEWEDPHGSAKPISYHTLLIALGYDGETAMALEQRIAEQQTIDKTFARRAA